MQVLIQVLAKPQLKLGYGWVIAALRTHDFISINSLRPSGAYMRQ